MKAYVRWIQCCNYQVEHDLISHDRCVPDPDELLKLSKDDITNVMCFFIMEGKNANGEDYNRDSLYDLIVIVQSFFKENRLPYKLFKDDTFFKLCNTLDNHKNDLSKMGEVAPHEKAQPVRIGEEDILWKLGVLGDDTPLKLVDTILYLLGLDFALHAA